MNRLMDALRRIAARFRRQESHGSPKTVFTRHADGSFSWIEEAQDITPESWEAIRNVGKQQKRSWTEERK